LREQTKGRNAVVTAETVARSGDTGRVVGTVAGFITGAEVGTVAIPVPVVGSVVGAVVGGVLGSEVGRWLGRTVMSVTGIALNAGALAAKPVVSKVTASVDSLKPKVATAVTAVKPSSSPKSSG